MGIRRVKENYGLGRLVTRFSDWSAYQGTGQGIQVALSRRRLAGLAMLAARVPKLQAEGLEEVTSPNANEQSGSE